MPAIANATAAVKTDLNDSPRDMFSTIETTTAAPEMKRIWPVSFSSCFVSGVFTSPSDCSRCEMCPTSVAIPVAVTTRSPAPLVTFVFM